LKSKGGLFWGWRVVAGAFLVLSVSYGSRYCLGVFLKPMTQELGWPVSVLSVAASIMIFFYGLGSVFAGRFLDYLAPKWIIITGSVLTATGFFAVPLVSEPWHLYLIYGAFLGLGSSCLGAVVCGATLSKWFIKKRGEVIGLASTGIGIGTMIMAPLSGYVVVAHSWQMGFYLLGSMILVVGVGVGQLSMGRTKPEDYGLRPDGERGRPDSGDDVFAGAGKIPPGEFAGMILRDRRFWILTISYGLAVMVWASISIHQVAYAIEKNVSALAAASGVGVIGIASIMGRYFFGVAGDRVRDAKYLSSLGFLLMAAAMVILQQVDSVTSFFVYAIIYGLGYGSMAPLMPFLMADRFGRHSLGTAYGLMIFFTAGIGGSIGPFLVGYIYDSYGSYSPAWWLNTLALLFVAALILKLKRGDS
jgi:sugar phosphate permease